MLLGAESAFSWDHGVALAVLVPIMSLLTYATHRIFDKKDGVAVKMIERLDEFFNGLLARIDVQQKMCHMHGVGIEELQKAFPDSEEFKTTDTNKSLADLARVEMLKLKSRNSVEEKDKEKIIKILSAAIERLDPGPDSNCKEIK